MNLISDSEAAEGESCSVDRLSGALVPARAADSRLLSDHTTFRLGGLAKKLIVVTSQDDLIAAVQEADQAGEPFMVVSGGSNMLISDEGFDGTVVVIDTHGLDAEVSDCGGALVHVQAGERWDDFVAYTVEQEWYGVEALSGIPGLVGAAPIQNIGAYGSQLDQTIARVRTWDRRDGEIRIFVADQCGFGYRDSIFKRSRSLDQPTGRYVVLDAWFHFRLGSLSAPVGYSQLAEALGVSIGDRVPSSRVREAVLALRASKGMVVDPTDHDTWSAGSFFMNPIIDQEAAEQLPSGAPQFVQPDGTVKTSAAWLIDHAGFAKGYPGRGAARLSGKHVLALTNRGGATAAEVVALARQVRSGVAQRFGIDLEPEPILVGLSI